MQSPKFIIITVLRNSNHVLDEYINAHIQYTQRGQSTVFYLVDNATVHQDVLDYKIEKLSKSFEVHVIKRDKNYLFTDSTNVGIRTVLEDYKNYDMTIGHKFCVMNPDIVVTDSWQEKALDDLDRIELETGQHVGILGFKLVKRDGTLEHAGAYGGGEHRGKGEDPTSVYNKPELVDWVTFACVLIKAQLIEDIGLLDAENYPHFSSDKDYCIRAKESGWTVGYSPVTIIHGFGKSCRPYVMDSDLPEHLKSNISKIWNKIQD